MILKHSLLLNDINSTIIRHIRTPPGDEPWATEPPRKTSSPTARMHHMKWEMNLGQREPRVSPLPSYHCIAQAQIVMCRAFN